MKAKSWKDHETVAEHYKALGETSIWLSEYDGCVEFPWGYVSSCEPGSTHRLEISTSISFQAIAPSGLVYHWSFDIEPRSANRTGSYRIATEEISRIMKLIPESPKKSLRSYITECAKAVRAKGDEWNTIAKEQYGTASQLEHLLR
jgi:hypothetical protein